MTIDVQLTYKDGKITAISNSAKYSETRHSVLSLSIKAGEKEEKIEAVGESTESILSSARQRRPAGSHTYRFIDPLAKETFEAEWAFAVVRHFCYLAHANIKPSRSILRTLVKLDRFDITLKLPQYSQIAGEKRKEFEKMLRQRYRKVRIEG